MIPAGVATQRQTVRIAPSAFLLNTVAPVAVPELHLPDESTRAGSVYKDRYDPTIVWYVPELALADPDRAFAFSATQTGSDKDGNPFNRATISLTLVKKVPADVEAARANPAVQLREVSIDGMAATLVTTYKDDAGNDAHEVIPGSIGATSDGSLRLTFDPLLGVQVIRAFLNLTRDGTAVAHVVGTFAAWRKVVVPRRLYPFVTLRAPGSVQPVGGPARVMHPIDVGDDGADDSLVTRSPQPSYVEVTVPFDATVSLGATFNGPAYRPSFTLSADGHTRPIVDVSDLREYNTHQSEFREFAAIDLSRYPSFSRLYLGAVSRRIVAIPSKYGIVRSSAGTAATCEAVINAASGIGSDCTFEFHFDVAPTVSAIDLVELAQELAAHSESAGCSLVLPDQLNTATSSSLGTPFAASSSWKPGASPHTFSLIVQVGGSGADTPAVANANLFIKQLSAEVPPYLTAQVGITLDDAYPDPVAADVVVNVHLTGASDELNTATDPASQAIVVNNASPLDLKLTRYATSDGASPLTVSPLATVLLAGKSMTLPLPAQHDALSVLVDRTLSVESPLTKAALARYVTFRAATVQTVQYVFGVNASAVDFPVKNLSRLDLQLTFADVSGLSVPKLSVSAAHKAASVNVVVPLEHAVSSLLATVEVTPYDAGGSARAPFTLQHEFVDAPILVLQQTGLPNT